MRGAGADVVIRDRRVTRPVARSTYTFAIVAWAVASLPFAALNARTKSAYGTSCLFTRKRVVTSMRCDSKVQSAHGLKVSVPVAAPGSAS
jgi:hypothetical protein